MLPADPEFTAFSQMPYTDPSVPLILHSLVCCCYLWDLLSPKREYNSLFLSDVHPYALFRLTAGYDCASIFFLQCPWIRAVTAHMPFYVWIEAGHCRTDKLLLVLLVIVWNGWQVTIDRRTAVSGVDAKINFYSSLICILNWRKTSNTVIKHRETLGSAADFCLHPQFKFKYSVCIFFFIVLTESRSLFCLICIVSM